LKGEVINEVTQRVFTQGAIIGEMDVFFKRV